VRGRGDKMYYSEQIKEIVEGYSHWFDDAEKMRAGEMTDTLAPYTALFEPITINTMKLKNRIVMGPMGNVNMADEMGRPSQKMIAYYLERAKGGVGLITTGMVPVDMDADPSYGDLDSTSIFPRIDTHRTTYSGWKAIIEGCHAYGTKFFIQLAPGMGRVGNPECLTKKWKLPISSSWNSNWYIPQIPCRPITDWEVDRLIRKTGQAAIDCKALGADGVYLHGHSGYLIEQMTDTAYNRRLIGKYKDYQRFGIELVKEIRKRVGPHYPIYYRIDLSIALSATYKNQMATVKHFKKLDQERTAEMTLEFMKNLVKAGVDLFDVDLGCYENWWLPHPPNAMPPGLFLEVAHLVKKAFVESNVVSNKGQKIPIVAVGKLGYPDVAERALRSGQCDMIMLSRPLLADPEWPNKVFRGEVADILPCIGDHEGCLGQLATGGHPHCAVNARTAFEEVYPDVLPMTTNPKRVAVIGAGPAGVNAAIMLKQRGHDVTLYDRNQGAGGMLITGSIPKIKFDMINYIKYLNHCLLKYEVNLKFNVDVNETVLLEENYDTIITCTGSKAIKPNVPGSQLEHVITAVDFLNHRERYLKHDVFTIIGGSDVGCEIAHMLAYEFQKKITLVEKGPHLMPKTCSSNRHHMLHDLSKAGVTLMNCTELLSIEAKSVSLNRNFDVSVPDPSNSWTPILADNIVNPLSKPIKSKVQTVTVETDIVILATGARADDTLYEWLVKNKAAKEIFNIGDSFSPGRVLEAVKAGCAIGRTL